MSEESIKNTAHDLNNILTSIVNQIELLKHSINSGKENQKLISKLENSTRRAIKIVHSQLTPNGKNRKHFTKVDIVSLTHEVIDSFTTEERSIVSVVDSKKTFPILADETDIYRILHNLVKNALEAIHKDGKVIVSILNIEQKGRNLLQVIITDNGPGIREEHINKIFDSKFSTKKKEHESGYGLSIVKEITEEYEGNISVKSKPGQTEFILQFPAYDESEKSTFNILLAEDDSSVSEVLADLLKTQGYTVSVAATGREAIQEINQTFFDALIIDKKMPEMDGIECIKNIRFKNTQIPIILASGSDINLQDDELQKLNVGWVIKKPYNFPEILSALQKFEL